MERFVRYFAVVLSSVALAWAAKGVTVMDLDPMGESNLSPVAKALPAMVLADLSGVGGIQVVDRQNLRQVLKELSLGESGMVDEATAPRLGNLVGAELMVVGHLLSSSGQWTLVWKLVRTATGTVRGGGTLTGEEGKPLALKKLWVAAIHGALQQIIPELGKLPVVAEEPLAVAEVLTFGRALDAADRGEDRKAREILAELAGRRPGFVYAKSELATLERNLAALDKTREKAIDEKTGGKASDYNAFMAATSLLMSSQKYTRLLSYVRLYKGVFPPAPPQAMISGGEMGTYYEALALYMLKRHDEALPVYEAFLKAFPASMYGASVKMYAAQSLQAVKTRAPKRARIEAEIEEEREKNKQVDAADRAWGSYLAGIKWMGGEFHVEALACFRRIPLSALKEKYGVDGDTILYNRFQCEYYLAKKEEGLRTQKTLESLYPESSMVASVATMAAMFPE